ncbi:MAG TPA: hypothetical protein VGI19_11015 [Candidatus Cybelea sp.]
MAVRAADLTLREFCLDSFPAHTAAYHHANVVAFCTGHVIEFQDANVVFAAPDAPATA